MLMVVLSRRQSTKLSLAEIKHIFKYSFCLYNHHSPKTFTAQTFSWVKPYPDEKGIGMVKYANHSEKKKKKSGNVEIIAVLGRKECEVQMQ